MLRLCSTSSVRAKILKEHKIPFIQSENNFDEEKLNITNPVSFVYQATLGKYKESLKLYGLEIPLLVVDSVVVCQNKLLRKAKNKEEAKTMLLAQSANTLKVLSCMILHSQKSFLLDLGETCYVLEDFKTQDLESYLQSNLWQNKAGAVMVEGFHQKYIKKQIGSTHNAMGLNLSVLKAFME